MKAYDYHNIIETIDDAASNFGDCITASEKVLFEAAMNAAKELDHDPATGRIKTTTANIARLAKIKSKLENAATSNIFLNGVRELAKTFETIHNEQLQYFRSNFAAKTLDEKGVQDKYTALKKATVANTIEGLTGQGLKTNVTDAISKMLMTAVTTGEKYSDLTEQLRSELVSSKDGTSSLAKYAGTYATTAMTQYAGQQNRMFTDDLDIKWFRYVGSTIETTRRFCELLTQKEYIHISEIPDILKGKIEVGGEQKTCPINPKTELPYGLIEGTTPENFAVNVGGWNCRHQLLPIAAEAVPKNIREKFEDATPDKKATDQENELSLSSIKQTITDIKNFIKNKTNSNENAQKQESVKLLPEYNKAEDIRTTMTEMWKIDKNMFANITDETKIELTTTNKNKANGSTNREGRIRLKPERLNNLLSLFDKISKGKAGSITPEEADAAATFWHEITHNKHDNSCDLKGDNLTTREKNFKELANEYVARHTLNELYEKLGLKLVPYDELMTNRPNCGYNPWVLNYQQVIAYLELDEKIILSSIKHNLFKGDYREQEKGLAQALIDAGLNKYTYKKNGKTIKAGMTEATKITSLCTFEDIHINKEIDRIMPDFYK